MDIQLVLDPYAAIYLTNYMYKDDTGVSALMQGIIKLHNAGELDGMAMPAAEGRAKRG